jgi:hypothetical protein
MIGGTRCERSARMMEKLSVGGEAMPFEDDRSRMEALAGRSSSCRGEALPGHRA